VRLDFENKKWTFTQEQQTGVRFQVLMMVSLKMIAFWHVLPCSLFIALMMEAVCTSETSVYLIRLHDISLNLLQKYHDKNIKIVII
jgi:putative flippase GtrA